MSQKVSQRLASVAQAVLPDEEDSQHTVMEHSFPSLPPNMLIQQIRTEDDSQQFLEIVKNPDGGVSRILTTPQSAEDGSTHKSKIKNNVAMDLVNFRLVRYADNEDPANGSMEGVVITPDQHQFLQLTTGIPDDSILVPADSDGQPDIANAIYQGGEQQGIQYVQVVERDQVPFVFFGGQTPPSAPISRSVRRKRNENIFESMVSSPNFKLFLYNCKQCDFKCNAIKELTAHRVIHQGIGSGRYRNIAKPPAPLLTPNPDLADAPPLLHCPSCSYRATSKQQLSKHKARIHGAPADGNPEKNTESSGKNTSKLPDSASSTLYQCEFCSLQTTSKYVLKRHNCKSRYDSD